MTDHRVDGREPRRSRPIGPKRDGTLSWDATAMVVVKVGDGDTRASGGHTPAPGRRGRSSKNTCSGGDRHGRRPTVPAQRGHGPGGAATWAGRAWLPAPSRRWISPCGTSKPVTSSVALTDLFGRPGPTVPIYGSGGFTTYDDRHHRAPNSGLGQTRGSRGSRSRSARSGVPMPIGTSPGCLGPAGDRWRCELYVDANGGYTAKQAIRLGRTCPRTTGVSWFEEPVSSDDLGRTARGPRTTSKAMSPPGSTATRWVLRPHARSRCRRLPPGRRDPVRRLHRLAARRRPGCGPRRPDLRALRPQPPRPRRGGASPTCATSSTSTITIASKTCSSTAPCPQPAVR